MGRQYANAPIVEAIVEFHVKTSDELRVASLADLHFGDEFIEKTPTYRGAIEVRFVDGVMKETTSHGDHTGFAYSTENQGRRILALPGSFAFVWRTKYSRWEEFIGEAERAWLQYRELAQPTEVIGIGVRFVNHIPMPERAVEIKDYLRTTVDVPAYLPQTLTSLFLQVDIPLSTFDVDGIDRATRGTTVATVTSAIIDADATNPGGALLLDIDVKGPVPSLPPTDPGFDNLITTTLERLRTAKNYVFEACITDATRDRIS